MFAFTASIYYFRFFSLRLASCTSSRAWDVSMAIIIGIAETIQKNLKNSFHLYCFKKNHNGERMLSKIRSWNRFPCRHMFPIYALEREAKVGQLGWRKEFVKNSLKGEFFQIYGVVVENLEKNAGKKRWARFGVFISISIIPHTIYYRIDILKYLVCMMRPGQDLPQIGAPLNVPHDPHPGVC